MENATEMRFAQIRWCNMGLLAMRSERKNTSDDFILEIVDLYSGLNERWEVVFNDTTYLALEIDFASKRTCADAFDGASCHSESSWKTNLARNNPHDSFDSYLHFQLGLVPKGGAINLLAMNFDIKKL
jgi:hypothetical protein